MKRTVNELPLRKSPTIDKISRALDDIGDCWVYNTELCEDYNVSDKTVARHKKLFTGFWLDTANGRIWSGSRKTIETIKEKLNG